MLPPTRAGWLGSWDTHRQAAPQPWITSYVRAPLTPPGTFHHPHILARQQSATLDLTSLAQVP